MMQIIQAREKKYDGRIYFGVRTTKIYCRPMCPARPKPENILFFQSSAHAEASGMRPCLRCRPDISPEAKMWSGTSAVVGRALRMIANGSADELSLTAFAEKLGMSDRHLRRLFEEHLGASPMDVAISKRLHLARHLLEQTQKPITDIALASGFGSIRRFNDSFQARYKKPPKEFRKNKKLNQQEQQLITLKLPYIAPYDWDSIYQFLKNHCIAGVERISDSVYHRICEIDGRVIDLQVSNDAKNSQLLLQINQAEVQDLRQILESVRRLFDIDHNPHSIENQSTKTEGIRIPGAFNPFETAIVIILGQMVSVEQAGIKSKKMTELFGKKLVQARDGFTHLFPTPEVLAHADLFPVGMTRSRAQAIHEFSKKILSGEIVLDQTSDLDETKKKLLAIHGFGPWTVQMIAMRCLADTDAFPEKDLIIQRVIELKKLNFEKFRPWRAYLTLWAWKKYAGQLSKKKVKK